MESANGRGTQPLVVLPERLTHWLARNLFSRAGIRGPIDTLTAAIAAPPVQTNAGAAAPAHAPSAHPAAPARSAERRAGKERVTTVSSRWSPYHYKNKPTTNPPPP